MRAEVPLLIETARLLRRDVFSMIHQCGDGHPGAALSITDILAALYFHVMRVDPQNPEWPERDRFILSKGHGSPIGAGMAAAGRLAKLDYCVYVITGDGELNEGILWEAAQSAAHMKLGRLIAFVDNNGWQSGGVIKDVSGLTNLAPPFAAFGWHTQEIDGHNFDQILDAIDKAKAETERPSVIVAHTIKGKGIPF